MKITLNIKMNLDTYRQFGLKHLYILIDSTGNEPYQKHSGFRNSKLPLAYYLNAGF